MHQNSSFLHKKKQTNFWERVKLLPQDLSLIERRHLSLHPISQVLPLHLDFDYATKANAPRRSNWINRW